MGAAIALPLEGVVKGLMSEMQVQLGQNLEQMRSLVDALPGLVAYWDRDLRNVFANKAAAEHFGMTPEQARGRHLSEVLSPETYELNLPYAQAALAGRRQDFERTITGPLGEERRLQVTYVPDQVGEVRGMSVMVIDVTERWQQQLLLVHETRQLREAQILGQVGSWELDVATGRRVWSEGLFALYGVDPGPGAVERATACVSPAGRIEIETAISDCLRSRQPVCVRYDITRVSDGAHRMLEGRAEAVVVDDEVVLLQGSITDITMQVEADGLRIEAVAAQRSAAELARRYQALLESTVEGVVIQDADGAIVTANGSACAILGLQTDDVTGRTSGDPRWQAINEAGEPFPGHLHPAMVTLRTGVAVRDVTFGVITPDGELRWINVDTAPLLDEHGVTEGVICGFVDVTERRRAEQSLAEARTLFAGVLDAVREQSIIAMDPLGNVTVFNVGAHRMLGYQPEDILGRCADIVHDDDEILARAGKLGIAPGFAVLIEPLRRGQPSDTRQWTYITMDGHRLQVMLSVSAMTDADGAVNGYIGVATDVSQLRRTEGALADSESLFRLAFDTAPTGMAMLDPSGLMVRVNPALQALTGRGEAELLRLRLADVTHPDDARKVDRLLADLKNDVEPVARAELRFLGRTDVPVWGQVGLSTFTARPGATPSVICLVEDITARKEAEAVLRHQNFHDALTGLANRSLLHDRLTHALAAATRSRIPVGVLFIDLDGFKRVNDTAGHAAGDELLVHAAERLCRTVRPGDTVARLGGDEFAVLCVDVADTAALKVAADRILHEMSTPFLLTDGVHHISASIGMQLSDSTTEPTQLLADSDSAMYRAKREGKNRIASPQHEDQVRAYRAARLGPELQVAVAMQQFVMFGQPVIDLQHATTAAVETLIRWQHPTRGLLAPSEFLDVAEESPLMLAIGTQALRQSCQMAASWITHFGAAAPDVHVNVSGRQLEGGSLSNDVLAALEDFDLPPQKLVLELTETHLPSIANSLRNDLNNLRDRGIRIAIDDMGTGYSSLTRITELPVDILKIDLSFTAGLGTDPACQAVVRAILILGDELGLSVVAKGVETATQEQLLRSYGCTLVQGYLYTRPLSAPDLVRLLNSSRSSAA